MKMGVSLDLSKSGTSVYYKLKEKTFKEWMAPYIMKPMSKKKITWDIIIGLIYLLTYLHDPYVLAFLFTPLNDSRQIFFLEFFNAIIVLDMLTNFLTGYPKEDVFYEQETYSKQRKGNSAMIVRM